MIRICRLGLHKWGAWYWVNYMGYRVEHPDHWQGRQCLREKCQRAKIRYRG